MVDAHGIPLAVLVSAANVHDSKMMLATVDAIEPIRAKTRGRPRRRPHKLHADKGYDYRHRRLALRKRRIIPRIARCGVEPKNRLGTLSLGGRTDALLAQPLPAPEDPLRAPG